MKDIVSCIEQLRSKLDRHQKENLKEYPTRTIFVDPLLEVLGWDVRDPDEIQLEYPTIDGKSVDYVTKVNRKPVLFIEAKPLNDPLTDVKAITQVVGYAANAGVEWCILTNGVNYKVYRSTEKAQAPDKLLFEVSIDPRESEGRSVQQIADQFYRFCRDAMARGVLDEIGEQVFTTGKIRKALDKLFLDPPANLKAYHGDAESKEHGIKLQREKDYSEEYHVKGKPREVIELFRTLDKFCRELDPATIQRKHLAKYMSYRSGKATFCCVHIRKGGLCIWLKLNYLRLKSPPDYVRDVSNIGHWGVGDVEIGIDSLEKLEVAKSFIRQSFEENK
jgi:predicted transport protein